MRCYAILNPSICAAMKAQAKATSCVVLSERAFGDQSQLVIIKEVEGLVLSYFKQLLFCSVFNFKPMWVL